MEQRPRLSLCVIAGDDAPLLERCLRSALPVVDEIVVVDTGTRGQAARVAEPFGAVVEHVPWTGDFARARNAGLERAQGAWILLLDADEELELPGEDPRPVRRLLDDAGCEAYTFVIVSPVGEGQRMRHEGIRLWRHRPEYRFAGAVHEQILPSILRARPDAVIKPSGLRILHHGYAPDVCDQVAKARRNLVLLRRTLDEGAGDLFARYNLGVSLLQLGQVEEACTVLGEVYEQITGTEAWAPSLVRHYALALERKGDLDLALEVLEQGVELWSDYTELYYLQGFLYLRRRQLRRAIAAWRHCTVLGEPATRYLATEGVGSFLAYEQLGLAHLRLKEHSEAIEAFTAALRANPDFTRPLYHLAETLKVMGQTGEEIARFLEGRFHFATVEARLLLADVLARVGAVEQALARVDRLRGEAPASGSVRRLRARLLMRLGRHAEAEAELLSIAPGGPEWADSRRDLCLCRWLPEAPRPADDALVQLAAAGREGEAAFLAEFQRRLLDCGDPLPAYEALAPHVRLELGLGLVEDLLQLGAPHRADVAAAMIGHLVDQRASLHLGKRFARHREWARSAHWFLNGLKEGNYDPESLKILAGIALEREAFEEAEQLFAEALSMEPDNPDHLLDLAAAYLRQAQRVLRRGLSFIPGSLLIRQELERVEGCLRWL